MKPLKATLVVGKQNVEDMTKVQVLATGEGYYDRHGSIDIVRR